jgi:hypothetical protein
MRRIAVPEASVNFGAGVSNAWSNVAAFVPKFAVFLLILIAGYLIAKAIAKILSKVLTRVGFDRLVERGGVKRALDRSSYDASGILAKVVYYAIMLFVLSTAFGVFGSNPISDYLRAVIAYLPLVFVAIVIAALDQLHIAAAVVNAILYAVLAALVGIAVVAVGGGGIRTMSQRWEPSRPGTTRRSRESPGPYAALLPCPTRPVRTPVAGSGRTATAVPRPPVPSPGPTDSGRKTATDRGEGPAHANDAMGGYPVAGWSSRPG